MLDRNLLDIMLDELDKNVKGVGNTSFCVFKQ